MKRRIAGENPALKAIYNPKLIEPCVLAGSRKNGWVIDPFNGTGTTGAVALGFGRRYIGIDINEEYVEMTKKRLSKIDEQESLFKNV